MALLRDIRTGEIVADGPPEDLVLIADTLGFDEVMFDGVGASFDRVVCLNQVADNLGRMTTEARQAETARRIQLVGDPAPRTLMAAARARIEA